MRARCALRRGAGLRGAGLGTHFQHDDLVHRLRQAVAEDPRVEALLERHQHGAAVVCAPAFAREAHHRGVVLAGDTDRAGADHMPEVADQLRQWLSRERDLHSPRPSFCHCLAKKRRQCVFLHGTLLCVPRQ